MRTRKGAARTQARRRLVRRTKGFRGGRGSLLRSMKETLLRAGAYAFRDRRARKRDFRRLWIIRINAACRQEGISYSQFVNGLRQANIELDRKSISEMAIHDPPAFRAVVERARQALPA